MIAALSTSNAERGYPPSIGTDPLRQAIRVVARSPLRHRCATGAAGRLHRHARSSSPPRRSTCTCGPRRRTRCCIRRSPTRRTRWAPRWPGCRGVPVACRADGALDFVVDQRGRCRAGIDAVGQQPVESHRCAHGSRRGRGMGAAPRCAGVQRRVLRRVHLGRPGEHHLASRTRRCRRRPLAVEAFEPRRRCASGSTPATPTSSGT